MLSGGLRSHPCQKSEVKLCIRVGEGNRIAVDPDIVVIDVREQGIDLGLLWDRTCRVAGKVPELGNRRDCRIDQTVCFSDQYNAVCSREAVSESTVTGCPFAWLIFQISLPSLV